MPEFREMIRTNYYNEKEVKHHPENNKDILEHGFTWISKSAHRLTTGRCQPVEFKMKTMFIILLRMERL